MSDRLDFFTREFALDTLEDTRTLTGLAVPYGVPGNPSGAAQRYVFRHGAFTRTIRERGDKVRLMVEHDTRRLPIGKAIDYHDESDGLRISFEFANTTDGEDALRLVRDGYVSGLSVGVNIMRHDYGAGGDIEITEAALREVSLCNEPALVGAGFTADDPTDLMTVEQARLRLRLAEKGFLHV